MASRFARGYGQFMLRHEYGCQQVNTYAHRVAYVIAKGDIPDGAVVMHSCDNPRCVNPDHLSLGTQSDNLSDAARKGRLLKSRPWLQKITDEQVREIRQSPEKSIRLAERFGVSLACISAIRSGRSRKAA